MKIWIFRFFSGKFSNKTRPFWLKISQSNAGKYQGVLEPGTPPPFAGNPPWFQNQANFDFPKSCFQQYFLPKISYDVRKKSGRLRRPENFCTFFSPKQRFLRVKPSQNVKIFRRAAGAPEFFLGPRTQSCVRSPIWSQ